MTIRIRTRPINPAKTRPIFFRTDVICLAFMEKLYFEPSLDVNQIKAGIPQLA